MEEVQRTGLLHVVDLVEVNPKLGSADDVKKTVDAAIHLLAAACGNSRLGNKRDDDLSYL